MNVKRFVVLSATLHEIYRLKSFIEYVQEQLKNLERRRDTQYNNIQNNDTQNDTQYNDIQH